ncbi:MAG: peptidylprolyl isomerase [Pseudomonadota bacterium]|nr:peptidylprolyl isomerase [Pseudomonadota bacterium]
MKRIVWTLIVAALLAGASGCSRTDETPLPRGVNESPPAVASNPAATPEAATTAGAGKRLPTDIVVEVDGARMTRAQLDADVQKRMAALSPSLPPEQTARMTGMIRKQVVDDFVLRVLMTREVTRLGIAATEGEIEAALAEMGRNLPAGTGLDDLMKRSGLGREGLRKEVALGIKVNKLVESQKHVKTPPTEKEVEEFYRRNQDKFKIPEAVHARHILVPKKEGEDEQARLTGKKKAEKLRQQLLDGKDFGELAKENSACPSKEQGGDLGTFTRGQMTKPFEEAAFSRKEKEIGPIVETEYGFHIIQVLEHHQARAQQLDHNTKLRIAGYLKERKKYEAFNRIVGQLKEKAHIAVGDIS